MKESAPEARMDDPIAVVGEARSQPRHETELNVALQILIPEETFSPRIQPGKAVNVSIRGMKVCLDGIPHELCSKLMQQARFVRVCLSNPLDGASIKLTGKIVWVDYHNGKTAPGASPFHPSFMGIFFENDKSVGYANYTKMFQDLEALWTAGREADDARERS